MVTANAFATCRHVLAGAGLADETAAINRRAVELACEAFAAACHGWVDAAVQIIGCGTTIERIRAMVAALEKTAEAA